MNQLIENPFINIMLHTLLHAWPVARTRPKRKAGGIL